MVIFLSYASEHLDIADQVNLALTGADYRVFFDRDSLPAGPIIMYESARRFRVAMPSSS